MNTQNAASAATPSLAQKLASIRAHVVAALRGLIGQQETGLSDDGVLQSAGLMVMFTEAPLPQLAESLAAVQQIDRLQGELHAVAEAARLGFDSYPPEYEARRFAALHPSRVDWDAIVPFETPSPRKTATVGQDLAIAVRPEEVAISAHRGNRHLVIAVKRRELAGLILDLRALGYRIEKLPA